MMRLTSTLHVYGGYFPAGTMIEAKLETGAKYASVRNTDDGPDAQFRSVSRSTLLDAIAPTPELSAVPCQFEYSAFFGYGDVELHECGHDSTLSVQYGDRYFDGYSEAFPDNVDDDVRADATTYVCEAHEADLLAELVANDDIYDITLERIGR